ncbi:hypothetical protein UlMin_014099 [Ulmus minor]
MAGSLHLLVALFGFLGCVFTVILKHFLPLFLRAGDPLPKGSFGWPIIGETLKYLDPHDSNSIGAFLQDKCSRYGKVFKSHLFFSPAIVSCDRELNYYILQNEGKLVKCSYPESIRGVLGESSMLVASDEIHKKLRSAALNLVTATKAKPSFLVDIENAATRVLNSWKGKTRVVFFEEARKFTFSVIVKQVLSITPEDPMAKIILEDYLLFMKGLISFPLYVPGTPYARAVKARARISSTLKAIIEERRRNNKAGNSQKKSSNSDFLEILLTTNTFSEDETVSFVLDVILGGYETTSILMAMLVLFLSQCPKALQQLKVEHENIRKMKQKDKYLNREDYKKMEFTQNVINETLRYGNVVKFVHRRAIKDIKYKDYLIPSGWKVLPIFTAVHLDPSVHSNALEFDPWRWERQDEVSKRFTPFGGGTRYCPGSDFARIEAAVFLHHLVQNYKWKTDDDEQPIAYPYVEFRKDLAMSVESCSESDH